MNIFNTRLSKIISNAKWLMKWRSNKIHCHREYVLPDLISYFHCLHLQPGSRILVPLCGKSKDMQWLAEQGYSILGVDLSLVACRNFFAEMNRVPDITRHKNFICLQYNNIELLCGDFFKLKAIDLPILEAVYDCGALVALPLNLRQQYIRHLLVCAGSNPKILLMGFDSSDNIEGPPFSVNHSEICHLFGTNYQVKTIKYELLDKIPKHLVTRGFQEIKTGIYLITKLAL